MWQFKISMAHIYSYTYQFKNLYFRNKKSNFFICRPFTAQASTTVSFAVVTLTFASFCLPLNHLPPRVWESFSVTVLLYLPFKLFHFFKCYKSFDLPSVFFSIIFWSSSLTVGSFLLYHLLHPNFGPKNICSKQFFIFDTCLFPLRLPICHLFYTDILLCFISQFSFKKKSFQLCICLCFLAFQVIQNTFLAFQVIWICL
jgi:hypothetical protein